LRSISSRQFYIASLDVPDEFDVFSRGQAERDNVDYPPIARSCAAAPFPFEAVAETAPSLKAP